MPVSRIQGVRLGELRQQRGVTQVELAGRLGWTQSAVSRFERQDDCLLSSADAYVRALGGHLVLGVIFADDNEYTRVRL